MTNEILNSKFTITNRTLRIDYEKVNTIEDIKTVLKALNITVNIHTKEIPKNLQEAYEKGIIKEEL